MILLLRANSRQSTLFVRESRGAREDEPLVVTDGRHLEESAEARVGTSRGGSDAGMHPPPCTSIRIWSSHGLSLWWRRKRVVEKDYERSQRFGGETIGRPRSRDFRPPRFNTSSPVRFNTSCCKLCPAFHPICLQRSIYSSSTSHSEP